MDKDDGEENSNYNFIYSPRTNYDEKLKIEEEYYNDLKNKGFDPYTIRILKKHFKEELGKLTKEKFICILKRHLLSWKPDLECREIVLIKLLSKFFDEIDINNNGFLEWNEFITYLINNPNNTENNDSSLYSLQYYSPSKFKIDHKEQDNNKFSFMTSNNDLVSYCFYIEKYKLLGIVHDGKAKIIFNNMKTQKRENFIIDLTQTQKEIDDYMKHEFKHKSDIKLKKEELDSIKAKNKIIDKLKVLSKEKEYRSPTPDNVKREIAIINGEYGNINQNFNTEKKNDIKINNRQFFAIATCFVDEYDLLFVSSSNCKITAWKFEYKKSEFINVNCSLTEAEKFIFEDDQIQIPLFSSELAQYTLCFDNATKSLYSGQEDGKIFKWEMFSSKPVYILDINKVKINHNSHSITLETDRGENKKKYNLDHLYKLKKNLEVKNNSQEKNTSKEDSKQENKQKQVNYTKKNTEQKRKTVSCLVLLNNLRLLCSAYYTGQIILWDTMDKKPKKMYNDQHTIIYQLIYNPIKNRIYSCGFEHDIFSYDPYSEDNAIHKFKGHFGSISSIAFNQDNNELISVDIQGNIKIWDTNTYYNFYSLNINEELNLEENKNKKKKESNLKTNSNYNLISLTNMKQFLIYNEDKIILYEKGKANNPSLCDDNQIIGCAFNSLTYELITFSTQRIKFWNLFTGKVKKMYEDFLGGGELFVYELDKRGKKCYLGENTGKVKCINLLNGKITKEFKQHNSAIVNIFHSIKLNILITGSSDMCVRFHVGIDDNEDVIREIFALPTDNIEKNTLKCLLLDENEKMLIMALSSGFVSYYDLSKYKFSNDFSGAENKTKRNSSLSTICELNDLKCVFITHVNGEKYINAQIINKYYKILKGEKLGRFCEQKDYNNENNNNNSPNDTINNPKKNIILVSKYDCITNKLFTGDHAGFITCYNLTSLYNIMNSENDENSILNIIQKNCVFPIILKIQPSKNAITFLNIPEQLNPKILLVGSDRTLQLFDFNSCSYIDSLKQISIKYNSVPIAIAFIEDNPFNKIIEESEEDFYLVDEKQKAKKDKENKENKILENIMNNMYLMEKDQCKFFKQAANLINSIKNKEKNFKIIYRGTLEKDLKIDPIDFKKATRKQIAHYSTQILEYNAKKKLQSQYIGQKLPPNKSTTWNLDIDLTTIINRESTELNEIISKVKVLDKDISNTENIFQNTSVFNSNYNPSYLNNINDAQKDELKKIINNKIVNTNLSAVKKYIKIKDAQDIMKYENKRYPNKKKILSPIKKNISSNVIKLKIKEEDKKKVNTIDYNKRQRRVKAPCNKSVDIYNSRLETEFNDQRFQICKNQFDQRIIELSEPIKNLFLNIPKRARLLPKLNINFLLTDDKDNGNKKKQI